VTGGAGRQGVGTSYCFYNYDGIIIIFLTSPEYVLTRVRKIVFPSDGLSTVYKRSS
jgi:hypothetical protein